MTSMHVVRVCHEAREERLCLLEGTAAWEVSAILATLFEIPGHKRVVGLVGGATVRDIVIPMRAVCRYPDLIFREETRLGRVFRIATKDADHEEEILYPLSALTPPPPRGCSDLPPRWASALPELSLAAAATTVVPELVSFGGLTPQQGAAVAEMISAEDPVIFAACLVSGAACANTRGDLGHALERCSADDPPGSEGMARGVGQKWVRGEALRRLASMLEILLADRAKGRVRLDRRRPRAVDGVACGTRRQDTSSATAVIMAESFVAVGDVDRAAPNHGGYGNGNGYGGCERQTGGEGGGGGGGEKKYHASSSVPEWFQADVIALADVALATGKITKTIYIRALHRAVILDPGLVRAYHADVDRHRRRGGYGGLSQATLRAFGAGVAELPPLPPPTSAPGTAMFVWERRSSPTATATATGLAHEESPVDPRGGAWFTSAEGGGGGGGWGVDGGSTASGGGTIYDEVRAREAELRRRLLRQALSWIVEGTATGGLSTRHRAIVEHAIATEHPWVLAIYEECKETRDVRGLVLNLQRLPALLERDQAAAFAADVSEPPPPGEADPSFWSRQQQHPRQQRPHKRRDVGQDQDINTMPPSLPSARRWSRTRDSANVSDGINATNGTNCNTCAYGGGGDGGIDPSTSQNVVEQLGHVMAGCSKLLQLRGAFGERQARALSVMASRASPVLWAAMEAYGANKDIEDLLHTLQTAAEAELSLDEEDADGQKVRPLRTFCHQVIQKQLQSPNAGDAGVRKFEKGFGHSDQQRVTNAASAAATGATATPETELSGPLAAVGEGGGIASDKNVATSGRICPIAPTTCSIKSSRTPNPPGGGGGGELADSSAAMHRGEEGRVSFGMGGAASPSPPRSDTPPGAAVRRSASGARAQELVSAKFAGIRSAAEARARASGGGVVGGGAPAAAEASTASTVSSSGHQGAGDGGERSGDKRLRQDVSRLIAVMDKSGMLTDRQRVYLLAQMGRRITQTARERHACYRESGDSKELYAVLMALSAPTSRDGEESEEDEKDECDETGGASSAIQEGLEGCLGGRPAAAV